MPNKIMSKEEILAELKKQDSPWVETLERYFDRGLSGVLSGDRKVKPDRDE